MSDDQKNFCPAHDLNTQMISDQRGQWKSFKWILGILSMLFMAFCGWQIKQVESIEKIAHTLDKTVGEFVSATEQYRIGVEARITDCRDDITDHEFRLRKLEERRNE